MVERNSYSVQTLDIFDMSFNCKTGFLGWQRWASASAWAGNQRHGFGYS